MIIDHFIVHIASKDVLITQGVVAEVEVYITPEFGISGFKWTGQGWIIPKYFSYLSGIKTPTPILNPTNQTYLMECLTKALDGVKLVLTSNSYGKSYLVNLDGATLMAQ